MSVSNYCDWAESRKNPNHVAFEVVEWEANVEEVILETKKEPQSCGTERKSTKSSATSRWA